MIKRLLAVPVRFGGEEHSGWLPANVATPPPTPVEDALVDFEVNEVEGGYILEWFSRNTSHHGDSWHETLEDALEQASTEFGVRPEEFRLPEENARVSFWVALRLWGRLEVCALYSRCGDVVHN